MAGTRNSKKWSLGSKSTWDLVCMWDGRLKDLSDPTSRLTPATCLPMWTSQQGLRLPLGNTVFLSSCQEASMICVPKSSSLCFDALTLWQWRDRMYRCDSSQWTSIWISFKKSSGTLQPRDWQLTIRKLIERKQRTTLTQKYLKESPLPLTFWLKILSSRQWGETSLAIKGSSTWLLLRDSESTFRESGR